jgi:hypothetical protein
MESREAARRASGTSQNGMRPIALGSRNWMHLGTQKSDPPVAAIMSVLASAQRASLNIRLYLNHCLEKLADISFTTDQIHTLLPETGNLRQLELEFPPPTPIPARCDHAHSPTFPASPYSRCFITTTLRSRPAPATRGC